MSSFGHLDVILLAVMLTYTVAVVIHVSYRCHLAGLAGGLAGPRARALAATLNVGIGGLKSIAATAPYLGLVGACEGILNSVVGGSMDRHTFVAIVTTLMALGLIPTAAAILVAIVATCAHNFLRTRIEALAGEGYGERARGNEHFRGARRLPVARRFSELPAYGLIAAPTLALAITGYMAFASFRTAEGLYIEIAPTNCGYDAVDRPIVLNITAAGALSLNQESQDWNTLADRLSEIYSDRENRKLYLLADSGVPFQVVARALDTVENVSSTTGSQAVGMSGNKLSIKVQLVTPAALSKGCLPGLMKKGALTR